MNIQCTCKAVEVEGKVWHQEGCPLRGTRRLIGSGVKSVLLNVRDSGFEHENNDCFVKALAAVTGVPYRDAHAFCRVRMQRKDKRGTNCGAAMLAMARFKAIVFGFRIFETTTQSGTRAKVNRCWGTVKYVPTYPTLATFARTQGKTGKWLAWSNSHAFTVIDGVVFDNGAAGARTQVTTAYRFVESSKCE